MRILRKKFAFFTCNEPCFEMQFQLLDNVTPWHFRCSLVCAGKMNREISKCFCFNCTRILIKNLFFLQNFPSCSLSLQSFQSLPKICSTWSVWCKENEAQDVDAAGNYNSTCDQSTSQSSINLVRVPPKLRRHHRKMPFRRRNWCGCIQVRAIAELIHFFRRTRGN